MLTTILGSFLFYFLISVPSRSISAADKLLGKTDTERFWTCFETTLKLLGCLLRMPEISVFEKEDISGKNEANMNYFETGKLVYPGA